MIAPEAANDAKDGGALLPALAFGIPGSAGTAILIGVLALHGIRPGEELMTTQLPLAFVLIWSLFLSNWMTSLVGLSLVGPLSRLTVVPTHRVVLPILVLAAAGAFAYQGRIGDVWLTFGFGVAGYGMKRFGWPRVAFIIAFVLGPMFELNLHLTLSLQRLGRIQFWSRPVVIALGILLVSTVWLRRDRVAAAIRYPKEGPDRTPGRGRPSAGPDARGSGDR